MAQVSKIVNMNIVKFCLGARSIEGLSHIPAIGPSHSRDIRVNPLSPMINPARLDYVHGNDMCI